MTMTVDVHRCVQIPFPYACVSKEKNSLAKGHQQPTCMPLSMPETHSNAASTIIDPVTIGSMHIDG